MVLIEEEADGGGAPPPPTWQALKEAGNRSFVAKDYTAAADSYSDAIVASGFRSISNALRLQRGKALTSAAEEQQLQEQEREQEAGRVVESGAESKSKEWAAQCAAAAVLYSNRAACFLKLGRYAQAKDDAAACVKLAPDFAKGHFRLALALQALEEYPGACAAFGRTLELEPKNKDAASGLQMAKMQAERQRRMQNA